MGMRHLGAVALVLVVALGCARSRPRRSRVRFPPPQPLPAFVQVIVRDAVIAPSKSDGRVWDGFGSIPQDQLEGLGALMRSGHPVAIAANVVTAVGSIAGHGVAAPEPYGAAELFVAGQSWGPRTLDRQGQRDTCIALWDGAMWDRVPLSPAVHISGQLFDRDLEYPDSIGNFVINYGHLVEALQARRVYPVKVDDQTWGQVLLVGIEVWPQ
ncbi:hypothetical protein [Sorangium sp. So ce693]|uniref:hypothetical protein n=1 Tax=Sorangium sp. So ce693 TaxID=3133318 RepID=UPI003F62459E